MLCEGVMTYCRNQSIIIENISLIFPSSNSTVSLSFSYPSLNSSLVLFISVDDVGQALTDHVQLGLQSGHGLPGRLVSGSLQPGSLLVYHVVLQQDLPSFVQQGP